MEDGSSAEIAVVGKLRDAGLIEYSRGHIKVLNRVQMERRVCECYAVVKKEFDRLLSDIANCWKQTNYLAPSANPCL